MQMNLLLIRQFQPFEILLNRPMIQQFSHLSSKMLSIRLKQKQHHLHVHIVANDALTGGNVAVGVDESAGYGVIVSGVKVIEACIGIIVITAVGEGVISCKR